MDTRPPPPPTASSIDEVAIGQRMLILAILVHIGALIVRGAVTDSWAVYGPLAVLGGAIGIVGLLRLATGLGFSDATKVVLVVLAFVPLASLVMLGMLSARATKALRAAGYEVGFFGANRKAG